MKVNYNATFQVSEVTKTVDALSSNQFRDLVNTNGKPEQIALMGNADTDWQDEIFRTVGTDHNIAMSGGTDNISYRASVGYANIIIVILVRDNMERSTISASLVGDFFDKHLKKVQVNSNTSMLIVISVIELRGFSCSF